MHLKDFLQNPQAKLTSSPVLIFTGSNYQPLFFSRFWTKLREQSSLQVRILSFEDIELDTLYATCQTSFLGQQFIYWCKDITALNDRFKKEWLGFCMQYVGPHVLVMFYEDTELVQKQSKIANIFLDTVDASLYSLLFRYFIGSEANSTFIQMLFAKRATITLDEACIMMHYQQVLGKSLPNFFETWFDKILEPSSSLFHVAQYLFARDGQQFMRELALLEREYPVEFWLVFWSEQLWQALIFVSEARKVGPIEARKKVSRLPFSFMTKDWKTISEEELIKAHTFLYNADFRMKNGFLVGGLDLFYAKFLSRSF